MVGIFSCFLIGYYNNRIESVRSGLKAICYNRVGDICLLYFILSVVNLFNDISISLISYLYMLINIHWFMVLVLVMSIIGKSAQIGFQPWLLDAMEGPTPVSALLHSATLVTTGIILLYKSRYLLYYNQSLAIAVFIIGGISCLINSLSSIHYLDLKRVIALSTCTHISLIIMILSIQCMTNIQDIAFTHLFYHGWSKSLLFILSGNLISLNHSQDIRLFGSLFQQIPILVIIINMSLLTIFGFPGSLLAYSKDMIFELGLISIYGYNIILVLFIIIILSQSYSLSLLLYLVHNYSYYIKGTNYIRVVDNIRLYPKMIQLFLYHSIVYSSLIVLFLCSIILVYSSDLLLSSSLFVETLASLHYMTTIDIFSLLPFMLLVLSFLKFNSIYSLYFLNITNNRLYLDKLISTIVSLFSLLHFIHNLMFYLEYGYFIHIYHINLLFILFSYE
jgi:NADH-quinone oxidoreductase subunit L